MHDREPEGQAGSGAFFLVRSLDDQRMNTAEKLLLCLLSHPFNHTELMRLPWYCFKKNILLDLPNDAALFRPSVL